jgi:hypothetical protein
MWTYMLIFSLMTSAGKVEYQYAGKQLYENEEVCYKKALALGDRLLAHMAPRFGKKIQARALCRNQHRA